MAKVMVIGPLNPDSFADNISHTLRCMGHEVRAVGPARPRPRPVRLANLLYILGDRLPQQDAFFQRHLIRQADEFRPDLILSTDRTLQPEVVKSLHMKGVKIALWFPDAVSNLGRHDMFLAGYDRIFFKNPALVRQLTSIHGLPASYLPEACNSSWHKSDADFGTNEVIVLAGNIHPTRAILIDRMVRAGLPVQVFGRRPAAWISFPALDSVHTGTTLERSLKAEAFRSARVVLNNLHPAEFSGVNCRVFEAAGSGAALLTESREGLSDLFDEGKELLTFSSFGELVERCNFLLSNQAEGNRIGDAAAIRAHRDHTYESRLTEIFNAL